VGPLLPGTAGTVSMKVVLFRVFAFIATSKVAVTLVERETPVAWPWGDVSRSLPSRRPITSA
jgi:hypothetical protein